MKYLFLLAICLLFSCNKEESFAEVVSTHIDIFVEDVNGNNLFASGGSNVINFDSINLIYLIDSTLHTVYSPNLDCAKGVCLITDTGSERIRIFPNDKTDEEYPITYIDWGGGDVDTLKCHFQRKDSEEGRSIICDKVWFNDIAMFPENSISEFGRAFKIIK